MKTFYEVQIICTAKKRGNNHEPYCRFNEVIETFDTFAEAEQYLKNRYGNCKRQKMYQDTLTGDQYAEHIGWVYGFAADDISRIPVEKWWQADWVTITKLMAEKVVEE